MRLSRPSVLCFFFAIGGCLTKKESAYTVGYQKVAAGRGDIELTLSRSEGIVRDEGVGKLRIGTPVVSVVANCAPRDTTLMGAEGMLSRKNGGAVSSETRWRGNLDRAGLARLPASTVVSEILIFGCHASSS